jgi:SAM-dependent methyltransferase
MWKTYWWLERRLAPGVRFAQAEFEDRLVALVRSGDDWLDIGCGHTLLPEWRDSAERELIGRVRTLVGLDPESRSLQKHRSIRLLICGDAAHLPFADEAFDIVTANMVVEHLPEPDKQFREVARVLKPRGCFVFHTPNANGYPTLMARALPDRLRGLGARVLEGRGSGDRFPTFYRANTPAAIQEASRNSGLVPESVQLVRSNAMFPTIPPVAALELLFLRMLAAPRMAGLRPNLIAVLRKPECRRADAAGAPRPR